MPLRTSRAPGHRPEPGPPSARRSCSWIDQQGRGSGAAVRRSRRGCRARRQGARARGTQAPACKREPPSAPTSSASALSCAKNSLPRRGQLVEPNRRAGLRARRRWSDVRGLRHGPWDLRAPEVEHRTRAQLRRHGDADVDHQRAQARRRADPDRSRVPDPSRRAAVVRELAIDLALDVRRQPTCVEHVQIISRSCKKY